VYTKNSRYSIPDADRKFLKKVINSFRILKSKEQIFYDMCFCLMTPQTTYKSNCIAISNIISSGFYCNTLSLKQVDSLIWTTRFHKVKANRLLLAKSQFNQIYDLIRSERPWVEVREWLCKNVNGFGMKTSSHFLRNLGAIELAIIDTHIIKYMLWDPPKNSKDYLEKEKEFALESHKRKMTPAELDSFIWKIYSQTPWEEFVY